MNNKENLLASINATMTNLNNNEGEVITEIEGKNDIIMQLMYEIIIDIHKNIFSKIPFETFLEILKNEIIKYRLEK